MAWSGLLVGYAAEILPYNIRAKGLTVMFLMVDAALWFNQFVNPIALDDITWRYYIGKSRQQELSCSTLEQLLTVLQVYCVWLLIEFGVVYFFYIETRYTPLEEIAKHFDGDDAIVGGAEATYRAKEMAAEVGGLDTVNMDEKRQSVEQREL